MNDMVLAMSCKFSQELKILLARLADKPMSIAEILQETAEQGFCLIIGLLALPFLFPMPPGLSGVLGIACFCLAIQMALGRKMPWLPKRMAQFKFPRSLTWQLIINIRRVLIWLEKIVRSRWKQVATNPYTWRSNACCIAWLSILLMLPIPFTNPLPAVTILLLAVATIEGDGLLIFIGYLLTLVNTILFVFIGYGLWQATNLLPNFWK